MTEAHEQVCAAPPIGRPDRRLAAQLIKAQLARVLCMQLAGQSERWTRGAMGTSAAVLLLFAAAACVLRTRAQVPPYRSAATVITNQCLPEEALAEQIADQDLSDTLRLIAERLSNGTSKSAMLKRYGARICCRNSPPYRELPGQNLRDSFYWIVFRRG